MAEPDYTLALGVKPIDVDVGKSLKTAADIQSSQAYTVNTLAESQRKMYDLSRDEMGRAAKHLLMMPEGPERDKLYKGYIDDFTKKGYLKPHEAEYWGKQKASDLMLGQVVANSVPVATHSQITGEAAGNEAAQTSPYKVNEAGPTTSLIRPAQAPGAPPAQPRMGGRPIPGMGPPPIKSAPLVNTQGAAAPAGTSLPTTPTDVKTAQNNDPIYNEVPKVQPPPAQTPGPGVFKQGKEPAQLVAEEGAAKAFQTEIMAPAAKVPEQLANYNTLRTTLESGLKTGKAGPALETVAGWIYAATDNKDLAKAWTGIDPSQADILHKATIQESMKFVRDTIGARESLMAIQAITSAFPNMANTKEGNRTMIDIMTEMGKYTQDKAKYAARFMEKNADLDWNTRMTAFQNWWGQTHSAEQYISRAMPRNVPTYQDGKVNAEGMQNGTTYLFPDPNGAKDSDGNPVMIRGKWDAKSGRMNTVKQ